MKIKYIALFLLCLAVTSLQAQVDRSKMPKPGPAPEINLGSPATFKLDNGLQVMVVENHETPKVRANIVLDNRPYAFEDKAGVENLYSMIMGNGTENLSKEEFNKKVDFFGARISYGSESASASALTKFFPEVFELMTDGLLHPLFTDEEFASQKNRMVEGIKSQEKSAQAIANSVRRKLVYGKEHPYGEFATVKSVEGLTLGDVKDYYNNFISPKNAYLVVVGDIKFADVKELAEKYLANWRKTTPPSITIPEVKDVQYTRVDFVNLSNAVQSEVAVVNPVHLKMSDPDYFPALIANQILGGGGEGRLFNNLREDKGYTYGAYSSIGNDKYVSSFTASASVRNEVTDSAVVAFLDEINRIRNEKALEQELRLAKAKYTGSFVRAIERPSTIASYALNIETENLPKDFYQTFLQKIEAVTLDDVQRVAKKYFKVDNARIVIVGKGKDVAEKLENLKYDGKSIPVKYFDKEGNAVDKPEYNKSVSADVTVKSIYDKYIDAIGGRSAVESVKSVSQAYTGSVGPQEINLSVKQTADGKLLREVKMGGMVLMVEKFDGAKGYVEAQGQRQELTEDKIEEYKNDKLFNELQTPADAKVTGMEDVDGQEAYVVQVSEDTFDYYSVESGLKLQTVNKTMMGDMTTSFMDYKAVNGVKFPSVISVPFGPQAVEVHADSLKVNEDVSDADFEE